VVTPDLGSLAARMLRGRWWHFRLAHVGYFDHHSLVAATSRAGLAWALEARARWFLPVGYLVERLASGLLRAPALRGMSSIGRSPRSPTTRRVISALGGRVIQLNLRDSFVVFLRRREDVA